MAWVRTRTKATGWSQPLDVGNRRPLLPARRHKLPTYIRSFGERNPGVAFVFVHTTGPGSSYLRHDPRSTSRLIQHSSSRLVRRVLPHANSRSRQGNYSH